VCAHTHTQTQKSQKKGNTHFTKQLGWKNTQIRKEKKHVAINTPQRRKGAHYIWKEPTQSSKVAWRGTFCPQTQGMNNIVVIITTAATRLHQDLQSNTSLSPPSLFVGFLY
jgi:hypothetical protein